MLVALLPLITFGLAALLLALFCFLCKGQVRATQAAINDREIKRLREEVNDQRSARERIVDEYHNERAARNKEIGVLRESLDSAQAEVRQYERIIENAKKALNGTGEAQ